MTSRTKPAARTQMLIRRPVSQVFAAFIDPAITTKFWYTRSSGKMAAGRELEWDWEMYGVSARVMVRDIEQDERILIEWGEPKTFVEWLFTARPDDTTLVRISNWGFSGSDEEVVDFALDAMGGFTLLLAGLKAWLEHGVALNLVADHHPDAHVSTGTG